MNIRELLDKIDNIAVKESITMQDVQAAIAGKNNEQDRARALMDLSAKNGLPGLYDPVSGYFVSSTPDTSGEWQGPGSQDKPRISATGSEAINKQLAGLGLLPKNAKQSALGGLFGTGSLFGSSEENDKARQANVTTSDKVIANQTSARVNGENLKKLTDIVARLEKTIPATDINYSKNPNIDDATRQAALASVKEDIAIAKRLIESFGYVAEVGGGALARTAAGAVVGGGIVAHNALKVPDGEEAGFWEKEIIPGIPYSPLDIAIDLGFIAAGVAVGALGGPAGEGLAITANVTRITRICTIIKKVFSTINPIQKIAVKGQKGVEILKSAVKAAKESVTFSVIANTIMGLLKDAHIMETGSIASLSVQLRLLEEIATIEENWALDLLKGVTKSGGKDVVQSGGKKVLQLTYDDLMTIDGKDLIREIPDSSRNKVIDWLKANPGKTVAAAVTALGLANMPAPSTPSTTPITPIGQGGLNKKWPTTPEEIKTFQKVNKDPRTGGNLEVDGMIGSHTYQALIQLGYKPPPGFTVTAYKINQKPDEKKPDEKKPDEKKPEGPTTIAPSPEQAEMIKQVQQLMAQLSDTGDDPATSQALAHAQEIISKFNTQ
jgi:hypothetical protein